MTKTYQGSCVCGAVRYTVDLDLAAGTIRCNCSFCRKNRFWFAQVKPEALRIASGGDALTDFQRVPPSMPQAYLHFLFCARCGARPFTKGGEDFYAVNLACLDDATDEELATAPIHYADGRHDDWRTTPAETRYL